jgi:hypothetical protein
MKSFKDDYEGSDGESLLSSPEKHDEQSTELLSPTRRRLNAPVWFISTVALLFFCILQFVLLAAVVSHQHVSDSYEHGYSTELGNADTKTSDWMAKLTMTDVLKPSIKLRQMRFDNAFIIRDNLTMYMKVEPDTPKYVRSAGATQEEIDMAWEELLDNRSVKLKDSEVAWLDSDQKLPDLTYNDDPDLPGYFAGPDFLHSLHCLNVLRKRVDPEHYSHEWAGDYSAAAAMHLDHCIEQLRQQVLCHGDATPVSIKPIMGRHGETFVLLGETERMHTCRDGLAMREKWQERGRETGSLRHS